MTIPPGDGSPIEPTALQSVGNPQPGWYPQDGVQRYWDGQGWTSHTAPLPVAALQPVHPQLAPQYPVAPQTFLVQHVSVNRPPNTGVVVVAWILAVITLGYLLPWAVAETRGRPNSLAIGLLNFLVGWTFLGWLAALVMACSNS